MVTGELKSKIDAVWNDFWAGGIANPPTSFDPNLTSLSAGTFYALYDPLTRIDEQANVQPALAESWRAVDDTTWEFKLRSAKWSDGTNFTAASVVSLSATCSVRRMLMGQA